MEKQRYVAPEGIVIAIKPEGMIAVSGEDPNFNGFNEEIFW